MADPRTVTIGDGKTYATLAAALAAETYKVLTSDNGNGGPGILIYECYNLAGGAAEVPAATISVAGYTTSDTCYVIVRGAPSEKTAANSGLYSTQRYRIESEQNIIAFSVTSAYTRVEDLQIKVTAVGSATQALAFQMAAANITAERCIAKATITGSNSADHFGFSLALANSTLTCINCLAYDFVNGAETGHSGFRCGLSTHVMRTYNCTAQNCNQGYWRQSGGTFEAYNCGAASCNGGFVGTITQSACSSAAPTFKDATGDDFHLGDLDTAWKNHGLDRSAAGYTTDIDGDPRSGYWDIGFDEYIVARNPVPMGWILE